MNRLPEPEEQREAKSAGDISKLGVGIGLGVAIGTALGIAFDNLAMGIGLGVAIGSALSLSQMKQENTNRE